LLADQDGREWIHLDVMDGHFVPNLSFGPQTVADLREHSSMFFDVHLMLDNPQDHIDSFVLAGADLISIHVEPEYEIAEALSKIKSLGKKCGIVLNPDTPAEEASPYLDQVDLVLCMTVNPGFGGQGFIEGVLSKVRDLADRRAESGASYLLEVDGGVGLDQVDDCVRAGVDVLVAGTAYFGADSQTRARFASSVENRGEPELSS